MLSVTFKGLSRGALSNFQDPSILQNENESGYLTRLILSKGEEKSYVLQLNMIFKRK